MQIQMQASKEQLYPPQEVAVARGKELKRCPVLGTMGAGKTRVGLEIYGPMVRSRPAIIVCGNNAKPAWYRQLQQWLDVSPDDIVDVTGTKKDRTKILKHMHQYRFLLITYASYYNDCLELIPKDLDTFMDEYHKFMRNRTKMWERIKSHVLHSEYLLPTTGTPMRHGPQDMWPVLHMCNRRAFPSYWKYVKIWCRVVDGYFGMEIVGAKNMESFREFVYAKHCAYMPKSETDKYLPKKTRQFIPVEPTRFQRKLVDKMEEELRIELSSGQIQLVLNQMVSIARERQLLVTPKLLDPTWENGAGLDALLEKLEELDVPRPVVFTDFASALPIIASVIEKEFPGRTVHQFRGGMSMDELIKKTDTFNKSTDDVAVVSMQFAESFEFPRSQVAFVLGFNWHADICEQAEDRLRRAISEHGNIKIFYFQYVNTIEDHVLQILRSAYNTVKSVTPEDIRHALKHRGH